VDAPVVGSEVDVQIRHRARPARGTIVRIGDAEVEIALDDAVSAITPGQSLVLYEGSKVLGGGVIERARRELPILAA
jgi:tRNA-specific 2-thiouridylase